VLQGQTGLELLVDLHQDAITRSVPVVVFTGSLREADLWMSYRVGGNAYVVKPQDRTAFRDAVVKTVHFWAHVNYRPS
jgi:CheY-like chemotaxis protein